MSEHQFGGDAALAVPYGFRFHHLGYACTCLARERSLFEFMGYRQQGEEFTDARQGVRGCFLQGPGPQIELLEDVPPSQTLAPWLSAGSKLYHLAFEVDLVLEEALRWALQQRGRVTVQPVPARAFDGRRICFVMFRQGLLVELIEGGHLQSVTVAP